MRQPKVLESVNENMMVNRVKGLGQVNVDGCTVMLFVNGGSDLVYDLKGSCGTAMTSTEARLRSGKETMGFEMFGNLFIDQAFKVFQETG